VASITAAHHMMGTWLVTQKWEEIRLQMVYLVTVYGLKQHVLLSKYHTVP